MNDSELPDGPGVYVIHLDRPIRHVRNYLGSGKSIRGRIAGHRSGNGARVIAEANRLRIGWHVSRIWETDTEADARLVENWLKNRRETPRFCPDCTPGTTQATNPKRSAQRSRPGRHPPIRKQETRS